MFVRRSRTPNWSRAFARAIAAALGTNPAAALLDTPVVKLWKDEAFVPTPDTLEAAFDAVEADFDDYAAKAFTPAVPANAGSAIVGAAGTVTFTIAEAVVDTTNTIYGYWLADANGVVAFEKFTDEDVCSMAVDGASLILTLFLPIDLQVELPESL